MDLPTPLDIDLSRADAEHLQGVLLQHPQATGLVTAHWVVDGMYCRSLWRPAGCLVTGKVHKRDHLYIVASGTVDILGRGRVVGPAVIMSRPGTKRAVYAVTDATCITVHRISDLPSTAGLPEIEAALVEDDPASAFGVGNELKPAAIEAEAQELLP